MSTSVVDQWRAFVSGGMRGPKGYAYILEHRPVILEGRGRGSAADTELCTAIQIGLAYPGHPMVAAFARRSLELADWALQDMEGLNVVSAERENERYHARFCRSCSASMVGVADLDRRLLAGAAADLLLFMQGGMQESGWDSASQSLCLEAATLFLLAGEIGQANELLSGKRKFKYFKPWRQGLMQMVAALAEGGPRPVRFSDAPQFEELFQQLRPFQEPDWFERKGIVSHHTLLFELSLLRYLYITHPNQPIDWKRVFEQVAYDWV